RGVRSGSVDVDVANRARRMARIVGRHGRESVDPVAGRNRPGDAVGAGCGDRSERAPDAGCAVRALVRALEELDLSYPADAGLPGEASLALAVRLTVPLTTSPVPGLEKVTAGGVLSTRVEIDAEVCVLPAMSVATTRKS